MVDAKASLQYTAAMQYRKPSRTQYCDGIVVTRCRPVPENKRSTFTCGTFLLVYENTFHVICSARIQPAVRPTCNREIDICRTRLTEGDGDIRISYSHVGCLHAILKVDDTNKCTRKCFRCKHVSLKFSLMERQTSQQTSFVAL